MRAIRSLLLVFSVCFSFSLKAQQFGGNPPSLKWNQINTDTARIIFPAGLETQATDVARIVHALARTTERTIGRNIRKINIVLQNQTTVSNGYVGLGPYRSEFFLTPDQNSFELGSLPWHKTLALHEYRHVQQNNNFRKGLTRAFYYAFGEEGQALASDLAIPNWFWEGDAVFQETKMSRQGRGRIPYFFNDYRSIWAAGKKYSWMKLRNGSYRDLTPDHYRLGYMLVNYGREKYGDTLWAAVTDRASRFSGLFYPFQSAIKKITEESFSDFRRNALDHFGRQQPPVQDSSALFAAQHRHFVADEEYPQWMDPGSIVYAKSSYKNIPAFYARNIRSGTEKRIKVKDVSDDNYFSYKNGRIVYAAYRPDARWTWKNFSVINVVDVASGRQRTIVKRSKYFSPDISADGKSIVAVAMEPSGAVRLHLLDAATGKPSAIMPNKESYLFTFPKFYRDGRIVSAVRNARGEMALGLFDVRSGDVQWLTAFTIHPIAFPQVNGGTVSFTMSIEGQEKLFAVIDGGLYRFKPSAENRSTGSYQLSIHGDRAVYNTFTAVGYHIFSDRAAFEKLATSETREDEDPYPMRRPDTFLDLTADTSYVPYKVFAYPAAYRIFHVHSWRPFINDPEYTYSLESENILNTMQAEAFVTYNRNEKYKQFGASLAYAGWFPVISGGASFTFHRSAPDPSGHVATWNEFNGNAGVGIPLQFTHGSFNQTLRFATSFNTQQVFYTGDSKGRYGDKKFNYGDVSLSAVNQQITARQQIYPRYAQSLYIRYRSIFHKYEANQLLLSGSVYLPGFSTNHGIVLQAAYQRRDTANQYNFSNGFPISRGYSDINLPRMWKAGINYFFPVAYPDWGFGNLFFLQRLRGNIYFDYSEVKSLRYQTLNSFRSVGAELYFDSKWWNQLPVSFGIRYSHLLDADPSGRLPNQWELVLPLNLLGR